MGHVQLAVLAATLCWLHAAGQTCGSILLAQTVADQQQMQQDTGPQSWLVAVASACG